MRRLATCRCRNRPVEDAGLLPSVDSAAPLISPDPSHTHLPPRAPPQHAPASVPAPAPSQALVDKRMARSGPGRGALFSRTGGNWNPRRRCRDRQESASHPAGGNFGKEASSNATGARQAQRAVVDHADHGGKDHQPSTEFKRRHVTPIAGAGGLWRPPQLRETLASAAGA
jgi:hypothetical protein